MLDLVGDIRFLHLLVCSWNSTVYLKLISQWSLWYRPVSSTADLFLSREQMVFLSVGCFYGSESDFRLSLHVLLDTGHGSGCSCRHAGRVASIYCGYNRAGNARGPDHNNRCRRPGFRHRRRDSEYPAPTRPNCSIAASYESLV